jgi:hypothetical protein
MRLKVFVWGAGSTFESLRSGVDSKPWTYALGVDRCVSMTQQQDHLDELVLNFQAQRLNETEVIPQVLHSHQHQHFLH